MKKIFKKFLSIVLFGIGATYIVAAPIMYISDQAIIHFNVNSKEDVTFLMVAGLVLVFLSNFSNITEFGLWGLKAKLERALDETHATIDQVKNLAKITSMASLSNTVRSNYLSGLTDDQVQEILNRTREVLNDLEVSETEINEVCKDFNMFQLQIFKGAMLGQIPGNTDQAIAAEWQRLRQLEFVEPEVLEAFIVSSGFDTRENMTRLRGYKHLFKHKKLLDFEDYKQREQWPVLSTP